MSTKKENTRFIITPSHDKPFDNAKLLGHDTIVSNLKNFLESGDMITPLTMAIHGDWGSGKTSIMRTLMKNLDTEKFEIIFFEPWRYENSDPALALATLISYKIDHTKEKHLARELIMLAANSLSKKYLGLEINDITKFVLDNTNAAESLSTRLEKTILDNLNGKKLLVIIDDLDRCDVENTLLILSVMKLFLSIENCICMAAVDFKRLQQAWRTKYQYQEDGGNAKNDGMEYLEKIFQIRIGIPVPSANDIVEYIKKLYPDMPESLCNLFANVVHRNPRAIKRMFNLIRYRSMLLNNDSNYVAACIWTVLEEIISNEKLMNLKVALEKHGNSLGHAICSYNNNWGEYKKVIYNTSAVQEINYIDEKLEKFFSWSLDVTHAFHIAENDLNINFNALYSTTNETSK